MRIVDILPKDRIYVDGQGSVHGKGEALHVLAGLLAAGLDCEQSSIEQLLAERERLQSTGIGDGVAIPHTSVESAARRAAALVLCPKGIPFDAIDGRRREHHLGVIGPARPENISACSRAVRLCA
jgi:PTS system nitrogen regulatory IIA component